jgi:hypothetical protein
MKAALALALPVALLTLTACEVLKDPGDDNEEQTNQQGTLTTQTKTVQANNRGIAEIEVEVNDHRSFLVTAEGQEYVAVERVYDPSGKKVLNWPVRSEDGPLDNGTWIVEVGAYTAEGRNYYYDPGANVEVTVQKRTDSSVKEGSIKALVVYAKGMSNNNTVVNGVEAAVDYWDEIWTNKGLSLSVRYETNNNIDPDLPFPGYGDSSPIVQAASMTDGEEIVVIIGESIDGNQYGYLGVSGNIPGTLVTTGRSATVVSWLANAGRDGTFDDEDIRLFGETLAHEVGHYLGLFHPVEDGWGYWDALDDTAKCSSRNDCEDALGSNLMFPYPVCSFSSCVSQNELTDDQQGVTQRYTGTK